MRPNRGRFSGPVGACNGTLLLSSGIRAYIAKLVDVKQFLGTMEQILEGDV